MDVEVRIDGETIKLVPTGIYMGCMRFQTPKRGSPRQPKRVVATVLVRPDWQCKVDPAALKKTGEEPIRSLGDMIEDYRRQDEQLKA